MCFKQETKAQLANTVKKLKEAREEGEQIRSDLKRMITQYQVRYGMRMVEHCTYGMRMIEHCT